MKLSKALELIKYEIGGQLLGLKQIPVLSGKPGIGKTESIKSMAIQNGYYIIHYPLSSETVEEMSGIPDFRDDNIEYESVTGLMNNKITIWSIPQMLHEVTKASLTNKKVLLILDDIHTVNIQIQNYLFALLLDRVLGKYKLPKNVAMVGIMNDSELSGFKGFNAAIIDRMSIYNVEFDFQTWYKIIGPSLHPLIAFFLRECYKLNETSMIIGEESRVEKTATPRSWTELSNFFKILDSNNYEYDMKDIVTIAETRVGKDAATKLSMHYTLQQKYDLLNKVKNNIMFEINKDDIVQQILMAQIIRYIDKNNDANYVYDLLIHNIECQIFVTTLIEELLILKLNSRKHVYTKLLDMINSSDNEIIKKIYNEMGQI